MATLGQYQTFSLIAYEAIRQQTHNVNSQIATGCSDGGCTEMLYMAKNLNDTVFNYSIDCISVEGLTEQMILRICNWLTTVLNFTTTPIPQLEETYLNTSFPDFNALDFNPNDFA